VPGLQLTTLTQESTPRHAMSRSTNPAEHIVRMYSWLGIYPKAKTNVST
jgi:hypothetical protein